MYLSPLPVPDYLYVPNQLSFSYSRVDMEKDKQNPYMYSVSSLAKPQNQKIPCTYLY
ncbi:hypothetical protein K449DRAFT_384350 [Hypoxylon sp. EC38]|nr:hypothetical protein K449DRAFT_384350 [Hypoxylon sp. EC38]